MKKVLFATSALVLSAGFATAEVAVSGDGRMGVVYDGNDAQFSSRARVLFTLTGESDAGLSFGGKFRVDQENYSDAQRSAARGTAGAVWVSGTYGKLSMGDVASASESAIGDLYDVGYTEGAFGRDAEEISYLTADGNNLDQGPNILYEYSVNGLTFYASASDGVGSNPLAPRLDGQPKPVDDKSTAYSLAVKYEAGNFNAGLGYGKHGDASEVVIGGEGKFDNFSVKGIYASYKDRTDLLDNTLGLAAAYQADAVLVKGFWRRDNFDFAPGVKDKFDSFGIGADYDLGGGAVLAGGIVNSDYLADTVADMGIKFKF